MKPSLSVVLQDTGEYLFGFPLTPKDFREGDFLTFEDASHPKATYKVESVTLECSAKQDIEWGTFAVWSQPIMKVVVSEVI